jgi:predicted ATP-dependent serine protease
MHKCKSCGTALEKTAPVCPRCGEVPGMAETITDLPKANIKEARKELLAEIGDSRPLRDHAGEAGGPETITDLPKLHLREAHKKLKEEIKEARESEKE